MRIACVHVPQFALQSLGRVDPSLRGAPVAVVGAGFDPVTGVRPSLALHSPIVLACSRAAWTLGVRLGMTASAARYVSPEVRVVAADGALERETVRAIADALLGMSAVVDLGGRVGASAAHLAMYCEVPSRKGDGKGGRKGGKIRGTTFGTRLLELLDGMGIAARIGVADDRFTAWVAAAHGAEGGSARDDRGVVSVSRGGSAAFLAPRPLSLLAITPEVQHMLEALGVRTLGEFAGLPAPSVSRPLEADYQALARGDSGSALRPYAPDAPVREELVVGGGASLFVGATAVATLAERLALRLIGRGREASRIELTIYGERGERVIPLVAVDAASSQDELVELIAPEISEARGTVLRLRAVVVGEAIAGADEADGADTAAAAVVAAGAAVARAAVARAAAAGVAGPGAAAGAAGEAAWDGELASADADLAEGTGAGRAVGTIDALAAALAGAGGRIPLPSQAELTAGDDERSLPWQLSTPTTLRAERRDTHRRTRRARRRRTGTLAQSQLFGQVDG